MIVTVIEHELGGPLDRFGPWLTEAPAGPVTLRLVRAWAGDLVPRTPEECGDGLIVLGGDANAYDDERAPWLPATRALMAATTAAGLPTLGICLGAQLLAVATGGHVQVAAPPGREVGVVDIHPRPEAVRDALLGELALDVHADHPGAAGVLLVMPSMHADAVVDLPAGAAWLACSRLYPYQAFRVGRASWGLQFHPEVAEATFTSWADDHDDLDTAAIVAQYRERFAELSAGGQALAERFAELVRRHRDGLPLEAGLALTR